jgi:glucosamine--fructose-6-phosphate aminotransferase (isomerizing)
MTIPAPVAGPGARTAAEIASQPQLWPKAVAVGTAAGSLQRRVRAGTTVYTGCGSTGHLAQALADAHRRLLPTFAWSAAASELWLAAPGETLRAQTVVALSRSAETTETIRACRRAGAAGAGIFAVTTNPDGALNAVADERMVVEFAAEESVVQTRSFTSMLLAALAAMLRAAGADAGAALGNVSELGKSLMADADRVVSCLADPGFDVIYVLGSGLDHGLARESALKIKEMSRTFTEALPVLDFRHGPISLVDERSAALVLCGPGIEHELAVAAEIAAQGAYVATVGPHPRCTITTPAGASAWESAVARLLVAQLAGLRRGLAKTLDPDAPRGVDAHITI